MYMCIFLLQQHQVHHYNDGGAQISFNAQQQQQQQQSVHRPPVAISDNYAHITHAAHATGPSKVKHFPTVHSVGAPQVYHHQLQQQKVYEASQQVLYYVL